MDVFETDSFPTAPDARADYDWLDFDARDVLDESYADDLRAALTGLPARPGTLR
ncbi:hypothetical protein GA0070616_4577 [Micromonospora nigra]|uniref:Uncharacterized protein n=1 Tax=Micromonospora nigra TaxID=145857 RepID=A0A1C6SUR0_9ACTN|nr:hypothetical protein [Micromonospora nigra]SCL32875.1 hypothetical protein GA0070616_4577 [Micromonospora nigra]